MELEQVLLLQSLMLFQIKYNQLDLPTTVRLRKIVEQNQLVQKRE